MPSSPMDPVELSAVGVIRSCKLRSVDLERTPLVAPHPYDRRGDTRDEVPLRLLSFLQSGPGFLQTRYTRDIARPGIMTYRLLWNGRTTRDTSRLDWGRKDTGDIGHSSEGGMKPEMSTESQRMKDRQLGRHQYRIAGGLVY